MAFMALLALTSADIYDNCGANGENCFAIPLFESDVKTCIAQRDCTVVTSFNREASGMIKFQIEAEYNGVDDGSHWVGLGFSADGGRSMGEDAVIACYGSTVANYWNTIPFWSVPLEDAQNGLMDASVTVADGKISCSFTKAPVTELVIPDHDNVVIDLDTKSYFLELATGKLGADGNVAPHQDQQVSDDAIKV